MKFISYIILIISFNFISCSKEQGISEPEKYDFSDRTYELHTGHITDTQTARPLLIVLHGAGSSALSMIQATDFNTIAGENGFIILYPNAYQSYWNYGEECELPYPDRPDDIEFIKYLLDKIKTQYNIDDNRIYLTGYSMGGFFSYYLARKMPGKFAAIAPVAALMPRYLSKGGNSDNISVLISLGTEDQSVNYEGSGSDDCDYMSGLETAKYWAALNMCNSIPDSIYLPDNGIDYLNIRIEDFNNCLTPYETKLISIEGGGHRWYINNEINTSELIFNFIKDKSL